jgi:predicted AAA+ superfamily ATPase
MKYVRQKYLSLLVNRLKEPRKFMQILFGARQVGKTTLMTQALEKLKISAHFAAADNVDSPATWIEEQWGLAHTKKVDLLVLDEVQKISGWSEKIKALYDQDTKEKTNLKVALLGSAPVTIQKGLSDSMAGRFEMIYLPHWSYGEMKAAFNFSLKEYLFFGSYPGAAHFRHDETRWKRYVKEALIETTLTKDILQMARIDKPALLRQLFVLGCAYSGQIFSFSKMLGQLHDAGNVTTLAHYLQLFTAAGLMRGIQKYSPKEVVKRSSIPKWQVHNNALMLAQSPLNFSDFENSDRYGRVVESAVGAHLSQLILGTEVELTYWREGNAEVDFILHSGRKLVALEVKSGQKVRGRGLEQFNQQFKPTKILVVGKGGLSLEQFFKIQSIEQLIN